MAKILYIFPHPDDESFGPAPAISAQLRQGHELYLLTLTKGEATKQRHRLGLTKEQMGEVRYQEMLCVEKTLGLHGMKVLNLPDGELKTMNPMEIEEVIQKEILDLRPNIIVTYAVHGISGFHDHLVTHAVVKRVFCSMKESGGYHARRLAFFTRMGELFLGGKFRLEISTPEEITWVEKCSEEDMKQFHAALDCYKTYKEIIEQSKVREVTTPSVPFEFFGEKPSRPLSSIADQLP